MQNPQLFLALGTAASGPRYRAEDPLRFPPAPRLSSLHFLALAVGAARRLRSAARLTRSRLRARSVPLATRLLRRKQPVGCEGGLAPFRSREMTARNRLTNDGMRRCQRLPELTHPVDFARPTAEASKAVPCEILEIERYSCGARHLRWTHLTCGKDASTTF